MTAVKRRNPTPQLTLRVYVRDGGLCQLCNKPVEPEHATLDHIIPLSLGGSNEFDNLQLAHRRCNAIKATKDMEAFRERFAVIGQQSDPSSDQKRISEWRAVRGMTQQELADAIGVSPQQVSQWETGYRGIAARRLRDGARALRVSMDDIMLPGDDDQPNV